MKKLKGVLLGLALIGATSTLLVGCDKTEDIVGFSIDTTNVETVLEYNEALDLSNLVLKSKFEDGSEKNIRNDDAELYVDMGGFNKTVPGKYTISYIYKGFKQSFDVVVGMADIVNFRIDRSGIPKQIEYGGHVDWSQLKAYAVREDGSETLLDPSEYVLNNFYFDSSLRGYYTIQVVYADYYEEYFSIEVVAEIKDIRLDLRYISTTIPWGSTLDLRDLDVYLLYEDDGEILLGPSEMLDVISYDYGDFDSKVPGKHEIIVKYLDKDSMNKTLEITVAEPLKTGFTVDRSEVPETVEYGEQVDFSKIKVYETYEDGSKVLLGEEEYTIDSTAFNSSLSGPYTILVSHEDYPLYNFGVTVVADVVGLIVELKDLTTVYDWGQDYNLDGLVVFTVLEDSTRKEISYADPIITIDDGGYDKNVAGVYFFTLTYDNNSEIQATFNIRVSDPVEIGFEIDYSNVETIVEYGTELDLSGLVVNAIREDQSRISLINGEYVVESSDFNNLEEGDYTIYVKYKLYDTQSFVVKVEKTVTSIEALNEVVAVWGGEIDLTQLTVKVNRGENKFDTITGDSDRLVIDLTNVSTTVSGKQNITVKYKYDESIVTTFVLDVAQPLPKSLMVDASSITGAPVAVGSEVDFSTIIVKLVYEDDSQTTLSVGEFEVDKTGFTTETAGTYTITVRYLLDENIFSTFDIVVE